MSNPIDEYFAQQEKLPIPGADNPIDEYFSLMRERAKSGLQRAAEGAGNVGSVLADLLGDRASVEQRMGELGAVGAGILEKGILGPAQSVMELIEQSPIGPMGMPNPLVGISGVAEVTENPLVSDYIKRASQGLHTAAELAAKNAGVQDKDIEAAYSIGNFIGFSAPIVASVKTAGLMLGTAETLKKHLFSGEMITDMMAGLVYGGILEPGGGPERFKNAMAESANFGIARIVFSFIPAIKTYRHRRAIELDRSGSLEEKIARRERGEEVELTPEQMTSVMQLLGEENFIIHSAAAQELLQQNAHNVALLQAIKELADHRGSGGVFYGAGRTFEEAGALVERFQKQFPNLKFSAPIRSKRRVITPVMFEAEGQPAAAASKIEPLYDIYFGTKGLTGTQLAQLKEEGRFAGQVLQNGDNEILYVGMGTRKGYIKVKNADGHVHDMLEKNATNTPWTVEEGALAPEWDALYKDFFAWADKKTRAAIAARGEFNEFDLVEALRTGKVQLGEDARRAFDVGGALVHPEEVGLVGENAIQLVLFKPQPLQLAAVEPGEQAIMQRWFVTRTKPSLGFMFANSPADRAWRATRVLAENNRPLGHHDFSTLDEAMAFLGGEGAEIEKVVKVYPTGAEFKAQVEQTGLENAHLLDAPPTMSFEQMVKRWAEARNLPTDAPDFPAMVSAYGDRMRRELWSKIDPETRKAFERIRDENIKLFEEVDHPIEAIANMKGFNVQRLETGQVQIRQIDTGLATIFGSERSARDALMKIVVPERDFPGLVPMKFNGMHALTGGYPVEDLYSFREGILSRETRLKLPSKVFRSVRDLFITIEKQTHIPLWSEGFEKVDLGKQQANAFIDPWARMITKIWKGIKLQRKYAVVDYWVTAEQRGLELPAAVKEMRQQGFSTREIRAFEQARAMFDEWFSLGGLARERYIPMYYTRVRPFIQANGAFKAEAFEGMEVRPAEFDFWAEHTRHGEMAMIDRDPEMVMHKYVRALAFKKYVQPSWDRLAVLTGTRSSPPLRIKDLDPAMQAEVMRGAAPGTKPESPVLPAEIRQTLLEYLNIIRGTPGETLEATRAFAEKLFYKLGVETDARVLEEMVNTMMSTWYGAAMGARASLVSRNFSQNLWTLYTRVGPKHMARGLARSMEQEGFDIAWNSGWIRAQEAGVHYGDMIAQQIMDYSAEGVKGPWSMALASMLRRGLRVGNISRNLARKLLVPYSSGDMSSRAWAGWTHYYHTEEHLNLFESGKKSWEQFVEDGLPFFDDPVKNKFRDIYDNFGKESALRYVGKAAADESNFVYGVGAQPAWMQTIPGRLVGMFGTWPLNIIELYFRRVRHATLGQQAAFFARTAALAGAFANITMQTGISMWNWVAPNSVFGWGGGPAVNHAINLQKVMVAPLDQKAAALDNFRADFLRLSYPGQGFIKDMQVAGEQTDANKGMLTLLVGRPWDAENFAMNYQFDPTADVNETFVKPETQALITLPWLPDLNAKFVVTPTGTTTKVTTRTRVPVKP